MRYDLGDQYDIGNAPLIHNRDSKIVKHEVEVTSKLSLAVPSSQWPGGFTFDGVSSGTLHLAVARCASTVGRPLREKRPPIFARPSPPPPVISLPAICKRITPGNTLAGL